MAGYIVWLVSLFFRIGSNVDFKKIGHSSFAKALLDVFNFNVHFENG